MLAVVHDLDLLPLLATRVIGMADGRVCWDRSMADVTPSLLQSLYDRRAGEVAATGVARTDPPVRWARA
jgi:ABC-type phosphate/phosphonate transport system ATPase subunit